MPKVHVAAHDGGDDGRAAGARHEGQADAFLGGDALHHVAVVGALKHVGQTALFIARPLEGFLQVGPGTVGRADDAALVQAEHGEILEVVERVAGLDVVGRVGEGRRGRNGQGIAVGVGSLELRGHHAAVGAAGHVGHQDGLAQFGAQGVGQGAGQKVDLGSRPGHGQHLDRALGII